MESFKTKLMGILNVTPDSFYDGGLYKHQDCAIKKGICLFQEGANILDIGGESSRPNAEEVSEGEELERVIPVIRALKQEIPIPLSIDTMKASVAEKALKEGVQMINDVSGGRDPKMIQLAKEANVPICIMHMSGTPKTMQINPFYKEGVVDYLCLWFQKKFEELSACGIKAENILFDPGIGFGKTVDDNLKILHNLRRFKATGFQLLIGLSRKSFMSKIIHCSAKETLAATIAMNTLAFFQNVDIIRVHDIKEHSDVVKMFKKYWEVNQTSAVKENESIPTHGSGT